MTARRRRIARAALGGVVLSVSLVLAVVALAGRDAAERPSRVERGGDRLRLTWAPPALTDPETVIVPAATPAGSGVVLRLDPSRDYIVRLAELIGDGGLVIDGGRNVVLIGGRIRSGDVLSGGEAWRGECLSIENTTGVVHVEGVLLENCSTGIYVSAPAATLQLQNLRVTDVDAAYEVQHPDVIQTIRGPREVRIDRLTADFSDKGFLWMSVDGTHPRRVTQRRINFRLWSTGGARPPGPRMFTWHVSRATRSTCSACWAELGWFRPNLRWRLQDAWGTFETGPGTWEFVPYRITGRGGKQWTVRTKAAHDRLARPIGGRPGDTIELLAPSLVGERWTFGVPGGDFVPLGRAGPTYVTPGYGS